MSKMKKIVEILKKKRKLTPTVLLGFLIMLSLIYSCQYKLNRIQVHFDSEVEEIKRNLLVMNRHRVPIELIPSIAVSSKEEALMVCTDEELHVYDLPLVIRKNKTVMNLIREDCLWLTNYKFFDLDRDGKDEIFLETVGSGCGSCHQTYLYIIAGGNIIFENISGDSFFRYTDKPNMFEITREYPRFSQKVMVEKYKKNEKDNKFLMCGWALINEDIAKPLVTYYGYVIRNSGSGEVRFRWYDLETQKPINPYNKTIDPYNKYAWFWAMPKDVPNDETITNNWVEFIVENRDSIFKITGTRGEDDCDYFDSEHCIENIDVQSIEVQE